jgi:predicted DNA-binding transcriptional regulator YafY
VVQGTAEEIKIRFAPEIAGYIKEKLWHESQEIRQQKDGSVIFAAEVAVTEELVSWVMSWGSRAEVIAPRTLKDQIQAEAQAMLKPCGETSKLSKQSS